MDEDTGGMLLAQAVALDREIGALFGTVATMPDEDLRRRFERAVGHVMGAILRELILLIERLHPALGPGS